MSARTTAKENVCGTIERTPGQNLIRAVTGFNSPIGIPPYNFAKMYEIFDKALEPEQVALIRRGYGFGCKRESQKEIAASMGVEPKVISVRFHECIEKLKAYPYKSQLKDLVPTLEELFAMAGMTVGIQHELRQMRYRCKNAETRESEEKCAREKLEAENADLKQALETAQRMLKIQNARLDESNKQLASTTERLDQSEARNCAMKQYFVDTIGKACQEFIASVDSIEVDVNSIDSLGLSDEALEALGRIGIHNLQTLQGTSARSLRKLGAGAYVDHIEAKLAERGLYLREAC